MKYKNILVEKEYKNLKIVNPVKVTLNFDRSLPPIGSAILTRKEDGIYADINTKCCIIGLYPCIGFQYRILEKEDGFIYELSMCEQKNQDNRIKKVKRLKIH